jgi:hypothetical protein
MIALAWRLNEHLLKVRQTFVHVSGLLKKLVSEDTIVPQDFQGGRGPKNK